MCYSNGDGHKLEYKWWLRMEPVSYPLLFFLSTNIVDYTPLYCQKQRNTICTNFIYVPRIFWSFRHWLILKLWSAYHTSVSPDDKDLAMVMTALLKCRHPRLMIVLPSTPPHPPPSTPTQPSSPPPHLNLSGPEFFLGSTHCLNTTLKRNPVLTLISFQWQDLKPDLIICELKKKKRNICEGGNISHKLTSIFLKYTNREKADCRREEYLGGWEGFRHSLNGEDQPTLPPKISFSEIFRLRIIEKISTCVKIIASKMLHSYISTTKVPED